MPQLLKKKEPELLPKPVSRLEEGKDLKFPPHKSKIEKASLSELLFPAKHVKFWDATEKITRNVRDGAFLALAFVGGMAVGGIVFPLVSLLGGGTLLAVGATMLAGAAVGYFSGFNSGALGAFLENKLGTEKQGTLDVALEMGKKGRDWGISGAAYAITPLAKREAFPSIAKTYFSKLQSSFASSGFVSGLSSSMTDELAIYSETKKIEPLKMLFRGTKTIGINTLLGAQTGQFFVWRKAIQSMPNLASKNVTITSLLWRKTISLIKTPLLVSAETALVIAETVGAEKLGDLLKKDDIGKQNNHTSTASLVTSNVLIYGPLSMIGSRSKLLPSYVDNKVPHSESKLIKLLYQIPLVPQMRAWSHRIINKYLEKMKDS